MKTNTTALLKQTYNEWSEDKGPRLGAALAYYAIFSIPPLMIIALAAIGFIYSGDITGRLERELASLVGDDTAKALLLGIEMKGNQGGVLATVVGIGILLFGASGAFTELQEALNMIWGVKPKEEGLKGLVKGRFTSFTMVLGTCFLLLVSLIISSIVAAMSESLSAHLPGGATLGQLLENAVSFLVITALFSMIFKVLPDVEIGWSDVWVGGAATALLFTIGKFAIGMYIGKASIGSAYGAAGSIVVLITWIYYSAQILYFGAEFTQVYATTHGTRVVPASNAEPVKENVIEKPVERFVVPPQPLAPRSPWSYALMLVLLLTSRLLDRKRN
jgi:membrane protein